MGKQRQPPLDGLYIKRIPAMLIGIDVAMAAAKITPGKDMEEDVGGMTGKRNGFSHGVMSAPTSIS
jgi:hypothetical protein